MPFRGRNKDKQRRAMFAKRTTNAQYRKSLKQLAPFADADRDGVRNIDDCRPFDRKRQDVGVTIRTVKPLFDNTTITKQSYVEVPTITDTDKLPHNRAFDEAEMKLKPILPKDSFIYSSQDLSAKFQKPQTGIVGQHGKVISEKRWAKKVAELGGFGKDFVSPFAQIEIKKAMKEAKKAKPAIPSGGAFGGRHQREKRLAMLELAKILTREQEQAVLEKPAARLELELANRKRQADLYKTFKDFDAKRGIFKERKEDKIIPLSKEQEKELQNVLAKEISQKGIFTEKLPKKEVRKESEAEQFERERVEKALAETTKELRKAARFG